MEYSIVRERPSRKKNKDYYEVVHKLGACSTPEDAVEAAWIWVNLAEQQGNPDLRDDISRAKANKRSHNYEHDPNIFEGYWPMEIVPSPTLFVQDENGVQYYIR